MTKPEQFLWAVQTLMLLNANLRAHDSDVRENRRADVSAGGHMQAIYTALNAADYIPADMSAADAAKQFYTDVIRGSDDVAPWLRRL